MNEHQTEKGEDKTQPSVAITLQNVHHIQHQCFWHDAIADPFFGPLCQLA